MVPGQIMPDVLILEGVLSREGPYFRGTTVLPLDNRPTVWKLFYRTGFNKKSKMVVRPTPPNFAFSLVISVGV